MIDDAFEIGQIVLMPPTQAYPGLDPGTGFFGAPDVGCPGDGIGLLRSDHAEGQETLAVAWMLGVDRESSQIIQGMAPSAQVGSNHRFLRFQ